MYRVNLRQRFALCISAFLGSNIQYAAAVAWAGRPDAVLNSFFLLYTTSLVFFMQAGFMMICAGCIRVNRVQRTLLKNFLNTCNASLGFYTVGCAFVFGRTADEPTTFIGLEKIFLTGITHDSF